MFSPHSDLSSHRSQLPSPQSSRRRLGSQGERLCFQITHLSVTNAICPLTASRALAFTFSALPTAAHLRGWLPLVRPRTNDQHHCPRVKPLRPSPVYTAHSTWRIPSPEPGLMHIRRFSPGRCGWQSHRPQGHFRSRASSLLSPYPLWEPCSLHLTHFFTLLTHISDSFSHSTSPSHSSSSSAQCPALGRYREAASGVPRRPPH